MDIINSVNNLFSSTQALINFFFKSFAIVLSALFLVYSLVLLNQTKEMTKVIELKNKKLFIIISITQLVLAFLLLILAIVSI